VVASRAGIVETSVIDDPTFGNYVVIDHLDGYKSVYFHFYKPPYVQEGQFVAAGQVIGGQGTTGNSTGVHLHFGIILNGTYIDPAPYIGL
jgi:murein DD-endopeptidase MepM/ murein hydrolase activator NlpD